MSLPPWNAGTTRWSSKGPARERPSTPSACSCGRTLNTCSLPLLTWPPSLAEAHPDVLVLVGRSFAGYLAPRAACFDHRLAALVCDPAQPDMGARIPGGLAGEIAVPVVKAQMRMSAGSRRVLRRADPADGLDTIGKYFTELRRFTMLQHAPQITCPTLIIEAEHDFAGGGGQTLIDALTAPSQLVQLTEHQGLTAIAESRPGDLVGGRLPLASEHPST